MKKIIFCLLILVAFSTTNACKKDKSDSNSCGLVGTWVYSDSDPDQNYTYTETLVFTSTKIATSTSENDNGVVNSYGPVEAPYTTNADCTTISVGTGEIAFSIEGNILTFEGYQYTKQ